MARERLVDIFPDCAAADGCCFSAWLDGYAVQAREVDDQTTRRRTCSANRVSAGFYGEVDVVFLRPFQGCDDVGFI
jgi:hypothetical protein